MRVKNEEDAVEPAHEEQAEGPVPALARIPRIAIHIVKQNVLCQSWQLIYHIEVPVGISDVASFEVSLLVIERGACPGCEDDFQSVFDSS